MDYKNGKIYIIRNTINNMVYIGSTTQSLSRRMSVHKKSLLNGKQLLIYDTMNEIGFENFYIELIELYPCSCKSELVSREGIYIRKYMNKGRSLNMRIAGRGKKEYMTEYRETNKETIKEKRKEYREKNKEKIKDKSLQYYYENKEKVNGKYFCETCKKEIIKRYKLQHEKLPYHIKRSS